MTITDQQTSAAVANMIDHLTRGQDSEFRMLPKGEHDDDMDYAFMNGIFSLRLLAIHALEAVIK
jgi:hypothetical protein